MLIAEARIAHRQAGRCPSLYDHARQPAAGTRVLIVVAPDGHSKHVTIAPDSVDATALGACLKNVFKTATFPRGDKDHDIEIKLLSLA